MEHLPSFVTLVLQSTFESRHSLGTVRREKEEYRQTDMCHGHVIALYLLPQ